MVRGLEGSLGKTIIGFLQRVGPKETNYYLVVKENKQGRGRRLVDIKPRVEDTSLLTIEIVKRIHMKLTFLNNYIFFIIGKTKIFSCPVTILSLLPAYSSTHLHINFVVLTLKP